MTLPASVLKAMASAGCTAEQLVMAVEAAEAETEEKRSIKREQARLRQQRHRLSQMSRVTERDEALHPFPDKEKSPTPPKEINPNPEPSLRSEEKKRATRLQLDWVLPASWGKWAVAEGYSEAMIRVEADKFRDFWHSKAGSDAKKVDWLATWRNWMRNAAPRFQERSPPKSAVAERQDAALKAFNFNPRTTNYDEFAGDIIDLESGNFRAH